VGEPRQDYRRTTYTGKTVNQRTKTMMIQASRFYGSRLSLSQGSYNPGGVAASAGTHDGGGTIDVNISGMSHAQIIRAVMSMRQAGFAAWYRTPDQGFSPHIHAVAIGDREASAQAKAQIKDYFNGKNGLASHAADNMARPWPAWAQAYASGSQPSRAQVSAADMGTDGQQMSMHVWTGPVPDLHTPGPPGATDNVASRLDMSDLGQSFGWASSFLNSIPEVQGLFKTAVKQGWGANQFAAKVRETSWWRANSENQRQFQVMKNTDPQSYQDHLNSAVADVTAKAREMGAYPSPAVLRAMAKDGLDFGYNDAQLTQMLSRYIKFSDDHLGGQAGAIEDQARQLAFSYGVPIGDDSIRRNATLIVQGRKSMEQWQDDMKHQAISLFPAYREEIEGGQTMQDIAQPYVDMMASELGQNPESVKLTNPLIRQALNGQDSQGRPSGMDLDDFQKLIRSQPAWDKTSGAQDQAMTTSMNVLRSMGLMN
jgi:hypothetical protein